MTFCAGVGKADFVSGGPWVGTRQDLVGAVTAGAVRSPGVPSRQGIPVETFRKAGFYPGVAGGASGSVPLRMGELQSLVAGRTGESQTLMDRSSQIFVSYYVAAGVLRALEHGLHGVAHEAWIFVLTQARLGGAQEQKS